MPNIFKLWSVFSRLKQRMLLAASFRAMKTSISFNMSIKAYIDIFGARISPYHYNAIAKIILTEKMSLFTLDLSQNAWCLYVL